MVLKKRSKQWVGRVSGLSRRALQRRVIVSLLLGLCGYLVALMLLPSVRVQNPFSAPQLLGRLNQIDVYLQVGDVVIPNRAVRATSQGWEFNNRVKYWDSFLISAPVPDAISTKDGTTLTIPWTLLPMSVVHSVGSLDREFGEALARTLGLKRGPQDWHFERLTRIDVPEASKYAHVTSIKAIYAVNLFEFMEDLGGEYKTVLVQAISRCVMETVQDSGRMKDRSIAIPALAGAQHVVERELVLSFEDSFSAILDGVSRAKGGGPSQVHLIVWWEIAKHPEMTAALRGVESAAFRVMPDWRSRLNSLLSWTLAIGFFLGVIFFTWKREVGRKPRQPARTIALLGIAVVGGVGAKLTELLVDVLPAADFPRAGVAVMVAVAFLLGTCVEERLPGLVKLKEDE